MKSYQFTELGQLEGSDAMLLIIRASWRHGIYKTDETLTFSLWVGADGNDMMILPDGTMTTFDPERADDDGFSQQLNDWITANA